MFLGHLLYVLNCVASFSSNSKKTIILFSEPESNHCTVELFCKRICRTNVAVFVIRKYFKCFSYILNVKKLNVDFILSSFKIISNSSCCYCELMMNKSEAQ